MKKIKVLFVCIHNSARSQMAEALLQHHSKDAFFVESAGLEQGKLNSLAVTAMLEIGIDISKNLTNSVLNFLQEGRSYDFVITVCDESNSEQCPVFPGKGKRLHWNFQDPSSLNGSYNENLRKTIIIRDEIKIKILDFIECVKTDFEAE